MIRGIKRQVPTNGPSGRTDNAFRRLSESARSLAPQTKTRQVPTEGNRKAVPGSSAAEFPVVGIGASAGGLEAMQAFLEAMPLDTGMAFVFVTHQHPGHTSLLPELLAKTTRLPVTEVTDRTKLEPNHIYVGPSGGQLDILQRTLFRIDAKSPAAPHLPIDHFFRSLAQDVREQAICIILSGTGTDGTLGLKAIKGESGMGMVQQPQSAKYPGMPSSAIATGLADYTLPPADMPAQLVKYARGPYLATPRTVQPPPELPAEPLQRIFVLLRSRTGHDFSNYKLSTIRRRIERRMNLHQIKGPHQYVRYLQENPHELDILFKELLISVTSFFRDADAFDALATTALPALLKSRSDDQTLRIWVPGCATGEEVYSLAILLVECQETLKRTFGVQIFGTDLDAEAIETARQGLYPEGIATDVTPKRLERFFTREDSGYRIRKDIREMAIFAVQNVIKDPPFTKLDLLSCRNLLIYLNTDLQRKLVPLFHYALRPGGLLFLGPSETIGSATDLFDTVDKKWKLFLRRGHAMAARLPVEFPMPHVPERPVGAPPAPHRGAVEPANITLIVDRLLLSRFAPASVLVNERGDVVFIHGRTGLYLEPPPGQPQLNIHQMTREGLALELASALREASLKHVEVTRDAVRVRSNGHHTLVSFTITRLAEPETLRGLFLITFRPVHAPAEPAGKSRARVRAKAPEVGRVDVLERELRYTKESLQTTIEELETSNEELKSTNEELQSTNEELQSTNEELETSKEEMQSLNEELTTVNAELNAKVDELSRANDDMQNLLNSTEVATIFLDRDLNISRYTEQARRLVNLIQTDIGRPLADLSLSVGYGELVADCKQVLHTLVFKQAEVQTKDGRWFLMRILPYRTAENVIDGLVLTFVDINPIKKAERELAAVKVRLTAELDAMTRLQAISALAVRQKPHEDILEEVLDAALAVTGADFGHVQVWDAGRQQLGMRAHRGFSKEWLSSWHEVEATQGTAGSAAKKRERVVVEDVNESPLFSGSPALEASLKAGVRAMQSTPLVTRDGRLGMISTHFKRPHRPDERSLQLLDLLARQAVEILASADAAASEAPKK